MIGIRPYQIFGLVDLPGNARGAEIQIPSRRGSESLTLLETFILIAAMKVAQARTVFEFGTFLGATTLNLASNLPDDGRVFTLDLEDSAEIAQHDVDARITQTRRLQPSLDFVGAPAQSKITELKGDSTRFDFSPWADRIDLSFVDGGHDYDTVRSDTINSFEMIRKTSPSVVVWHDYGNPAYPELTGYLDALSGDRKIFHVSGTMVCLSFNDPNHQIVPRITG
jgi:hypothetical protein